MSQRYVPNRVSLRLALRALTSGFVFRGRSTRTEVLSFWILSTVANLVSVNFHPTPVVAVFGALWTVLWTWPWVPLAVRRLHDQGRSGWFAWSVLIVPATFWLTWFASDEGSAFRLSLDLGFVQVSKGIAWGWPASIALVVVVAFKVITFAVFFMPGMRGANAFGSNPRVVATHPNYAGMALHERLDASGMREAFERARRRGDRRALLQLLKDLDVDEPGWIVNAAVEQAPLNVR